MNVEKILSLMGTTPESKLETARRLEMHIPISACESANDLLNAELFGTPKKTVATKRPAQRKAAKESENFLGKGYENRLNSLYPGLTWYLSHPSDDTTGWSIEAAKQHTTVFYEDENSGLDYKQVLDKLLNKEVRWGEGENEGLLYLDTDVPATEDAAGGIGANSAVPGTGAVVSAAVLKEAKKGKNAGEAAATETLVEADEDQGFPASFDFDEEAFAAEFGIDPETIQIVFVQEEPESETKAHVALSFDYEGATVSLFIHADGSIYETVDAEVIEPAQFSASFVEVTDEEGNETMALVLDLVEEDGLIKSEEDTVSQSEEDTDPVDNEGKAQSPEEFVQQAGLDLDEFHAKNANIPVAANPANRIDPKKGTARANESLAAKIAKRK